MQPRGGHDWLDERFAGLALLDGEHEIVFPRQLVSLFKLGWAISSSHNAAAGTLYVLCLPVRSSSAHWIALGCLAERLDIDSRKAARSEFLSKQPGDEAIVALEHGPSRGRRVTVKVLVENVEGAGEERQIRFRIVDGKKSHVGVAVTMDYQKWTRCLRPGQALIKGISRKIDALRSFYCRFTPNPTFDWFVDQRRLISIRGNVAAMTRDSSDITIVNLKKRKQVQLEQLLCMKLGKVHMASSRDMEGPQSTELTILNGPEAVRTLQPGLRGTVVAILAWPEIDASVQTHIGQYLAADDPSIPSLSLSGLSIPRQWTLLTAAWSDIK